MLVYYFRCYWPSNLVFVVWPTLQILREIGQKLQPRLTYDARRPHSPKCDAKRSQYSMTHRRGQIRFAGLMSCFRGQQCFTVSVASSGATAAERRQSWVPWSQLQRTLAIIMCDRKSKTSSVQFSLFQKLVSIPAYNDPGWPKILLL